MNGSFSQEETIVRCRSKEGEAADNYFCKQYRRLHDPHSEGMSEAGVVGLLVFCHTWHILYSFDPRIGEGYFLKILPYPQSHECECNIVCQDMAGGF